MNILIEIIGWLGAVLIVGAYSLNIYGRLASTSNGYILCNLFGGAFFILNTYFHHAYPSMIVNIIWVIIAFAAIIKRKKQPANQSP